MATAFEAKDGRLTAGATIEPSDDERGSGGRKMLDEGGAGCGCSRRGSPGPLTRCPPPPPPIALDCYQAHYFPLGQVEKVGPAEHEEAVLHRR